MTRLEMTLEDCSCKGQSGGLRGSSARGRGLWGRILATGGGREVPTEVSEARTEDYVEGIVRRTPIKKAPVPIPEGETSACNHTGTSSHPSYTPPPPTPPMYSTPQPNIWLWRETLDFRSVCDPHHTDYYMHQTIPHTTTTQEKATAALLIEFNL